MGNVLKVKNQETGEIEALKYCRNTDENSIRRFAREVRIMSETVHANVILIKDFNVEHLPPYFVMPLARKNASAITPLKDNLPLFFNVFDEICKGISAMHASGHFHRDIKPSNVLILMDGSVVISDFGLAKKEQRDTTVLTKTGRFIGTEGYHAPEQVAEGKSADARTDIFQLGKTLYELYTGEYPYLIDSTKVPPALYYIIQKAIEIDPTNRFQTVSALQQAVNSYRVSLDPYISPKEAFSNSLEHIKNLLNQRTYEAPQLLRLLDILARFRTDTNSFIEAFDRLPDPILPVLAGPVAAAFEPILNDYSAFLQPYLKDSYKDFSYAEFVGERMFLIFRDAARINFKVQAMRVTLIVAVYFHRYRAMDLFDSMLQSIRVNEDAVVVATLLREEQDRYRHVYDRIPMNQLHPLLQTVWQEVQVAMQQEQEQQNQLNVELLRDLGF